MCARSLYPRGEGLPRSSPESSRRDRPEIAAESRREPRNRRMVYRYRRRTNHAITRAPVLLIPSQGSRRELYWDWTQSAGAVILSCDNMTVSGYKRTLNYHAGYAIMQSRQGKQPDGKCRAAALRQSEHDPVRR